MSWSVGEVVIGDRVVAFFAMHNTVDQAASQLWDTTTDAWAHIQERAANNTCTCGAAPSDALLFGARQHWQALVCLPCRAIVKGTQAGPLCDACRDVIEWDESDREHTCKPTDEKYPKLGHPLHAD